LVSLAFFANLEAERAQNGPKKRRKKIQNMNPLYNGYEAIIDLIEQEADSLRTGKKRPGGDIAPPAKKPLVALLLVVPAATPTAMSIFLFFFSSKPSKKIVKKTLGLVL
jgi:hypothetical protein